MIDISDKKECCGCTACVSICNHSALEMHPDDLGFLYPVVDSSRCVNCGLCLQVCQFKADYFRYDNYSEPIAYSARLKDTDQLLRSQSGGAFFQLAKYILEGGGCVYGAAFDKNWKVSHIRVSNQFELEQLRMSKYVQSDMRGIFRSVREDLRIGRTVLFSGTACQIAGLKSYISKQLHDNLICVDIICHGVPSPKIWSDYIAYLENKHKSKILKACFRDKRFGWHGAKESFLLSNGKEVFSRTSNRLYFDGYTVRESCANCHYTNTRRVGDITIGDHWGLSKDSPYEKDALGVSLILINSPKGEALFSNILDLFYHETVDQNKYLQPQLKHPCKLNSKYYLFNSDYCRNGFYYVARKYGDLGFSGRISNLYINLKGIIQKIIR